MFSQCFHVTISGNYLLQDAMTWKNVVAISCAMIQSTRWVIMILPFFLIDRNICDKLLNWWKYRDRSCTKELTTWNQESSWVAKTLATVSKCLVGAETVKFLVFSLIWVNGFPKNPWTWKILSLFLVFWESFFVRY